MNRPNPPYIPSAITQQRQVKLPPGKMFYHVPGVIYPEQLVPHKPGYNKKTGKPYTTIPSWGISSEEAADILQCTTSAARMLLHKHHITYHQVQLSSKTRRIYWNRHEVERLRALRTYPIHQETPPHMLSAAEAGKMLGVSRTSLIRYMHRGLLHPSIVRQPSSCGLRTKLLFHKEELKQIQQLRHRWQQLNQPTLPLHCLLEHPNEQN